MISLPTPLFGDLLRVVLFRVIFEVLIVVLFILLIVHLIHLVLEVFIILILALLMSCVVKARRRILLLLFLLRIFLAWGGTWRNCRRGDFRRLREHFYFFFRGLKLGRRGWQLRFIRSFWASREKSSYSKGDKGSVLLILRVVSSVSTLWIAWGSDSSRFLSKVLFLAWRTLVMYWERRNWCVLFRVRGVKIWSGRDAACSTIANLWRIK